MNGIFSFFIFTFLKNKKSSKSGFTLVELLVVIGVIAIIMVAFFPNFMGVRQRARDNQRKSDLKQIQNAMELYKLDQANPQYAPTGAFAPALCGQCWTSQNGCGGNVYMKKFPCDPLNPTPYIYRLDSNDPLKYTLSACLENIADPDKDTNYDNSLNCTTTTSYTITEP